MRGGRRLLWWVLLWWWPQALAAPTEPDAAAWDALAEQARAWIDLEAYARADALTRRGAAAHPEDPTWHLLRLALLDAAGMSPWIQAEYPEGVAGVRGQARAIHEVRAGLVLAAPDDLPAEQARLALSRGQGQEAAAAIERVPKGAERAALRTMGMLAEGQLREALERLQAWPEDVAVPVELLVAAWIAAGNGRDENALRRHVLSVVDGWMEAEDAPGSWLRANRWARAVRDDERAAASAAKLASASRRGVEALTAAFQTLPRGFDLWEAAPVGRRTPDELASFAKALARGKDEAVGWLRPSETMEVRRRVATQQKGADPVRGARAACAYRGEVGAAMRRGDRRGAREAAEDLVLRCVGGLEFVPDEDPVGLDVGRRLDEVADAWARAGRAFATLGQGRDAALALAVAARLTPSIQAVRDAREAAASAGGDATAVLASDEALVKAVQEAAWLHPAEAVRRSRAQRAVARTVALLVPSAAHLAEAATPRKACLPTNLTRCLVEQSAAQHAAALEGVPVPDTVAGRVGDPGAVVAAAGWLDALRQGRFSREAELVRAVRALDGDPDLRDVLAGRTGARIGRPAPSWSMAGRRSEDLQGRVVVLWFWATWVRPSVAVIPVLDALAARWQREGIDVRVFAIGVDESQGAYQGAIAGLDWASLEVTRAPMMRRLFEVDAMPGLVVIDPQGVLREHRVGYREWNAASVDQAVRAWSSR